MTIEQKGYFVDDRHALYVGCVLGLAMKHGLDLRPIVDEWGNYTGHLTLQVTPEVTVTIVVPPPPEDWSMETWLTS